MRRPIELSLSLAGAALLAWPLVFVPYATNLTLKDVRTRTALAYQGSSIVKPQLAQRNLELLNSRPVWSSSGAEYFVLRAANERLLQRTDAAILSLSKAIEREPRPEIYEYRALAYLEKGELEAARRDYFTAAQFAPSTLQRISDPDLRRSIEHDLKKQ